MQTTCAVLTPRAVWCRARATAGLTKLCQLLALSAWHVIAQERSAGSSGKQISALRIEISDQSFSLAHARRVAVVVVVVLGAPRSHITKV